MLQVLRHAYDVVVLESETDLKDHWEEFKTAVQENGASYLKDLVQSFGLPTVNLTMLSVFVDWVCSRFQVRRLEHALIM